MHAGTGETIGDFGGAVGAGPAPADGSCLDRIERALSEDGSPLASALRGLGLRTEGRGTCLLLEHEDFGEALIADCRWPLDREETLRVGHRRALVDLRQDAGIRRLAVLVEPGDEAEALDTKGCALAIAALEVTEALAEIAVAHAAAPAPRVALG